MLFLEKVKSCKRECKSKWWCLAWVLTCPVQLIGWFFVRIGMGMKWLENKLEQIMDDGKKFDNTYKLGFCPKCSVDVFIREKRPNGDDICANGHKFPSKDTLKELPKK